MQRHLLKRSSSDVEFSNFCQPVPFIHPTGATYESRHVGLIQRGPVNSAIKTMMTYSRRFYLIQDVSNTKEHRHPLIFTLLRLQVVDDKTVGRKSS